MTARQRHKESTIIHIYVYYRVKADDTETENLVRSILARSQCRWGLSNQLLKRCDDPLTWMEVYNDVQDTAAFIKHLGGLCNQFDLSPFLDGERHVECFGIKP